jgi:hypothetical protein
MWTAVSTAVSASNSPARHQPPEKVLEKRETEIRPEVYEDKELPPIVIVGVEAENEETHTLEGDVVNEEGVSKTAIERKVEDHLESSENDEVGKQEHSETDSKPIPPTKLPTLRATRPPPPPPPEPALSLSTVAIESSESETSAVIAPAAETDNNHSNSKVEPIDDQQDQPQQQHHHPNEEERHSPRLDMLRDRFKEVEKEFMSASEDLDKAANDSDEEEGGDVHSIVVVGMEKKKLVDIEKLKMAFEEKMGNASAVIQGGSLKDSGYA